MPSAFLMPDLLPQPGFMDLEKLRHAPPLDAVFQAPTADQAGRLQAQRRLVPTLRLEDALRSLIRLGADLECIQVVPVGIERSWKGEVVGQWPAPGAQVEHGTKILLFVTLPGLQDRLPDGILPSPAARDPHQAPALDPAEATNELLLEHRELDPGRRFLQILDGWMGRARAHLLRLQDAYDGAGPAEPLARYLMEVVGLGDLPADDESAVWLSGTLCRLPSAVAVPEPTGEMLTALLEEPTRIAEGPPVEIEIPAELRNCLGSRNSRLGLDFTPGRAFLDARPSVRLISGPESAPQARTVVVERDPRRRAEAWSDATLPSRERAAVRHELLNSDRVLRLGRESSNSVLGVTTCISKGTP